jgi:hypothetical protein
MGSSQLLHPGGTQKRQLHLALQVDRIEMGQLSPKERNLVDVEPLDRRGLRCEITRNEHQRNRRSLPLEGNAVI